MITATALRYLETGRAPGLSIAYGHNAEPIVSCAYGVGDAAVNDSCTAGTKFCIGSVTKQFTAAAVLSTAASTGLDIDEDIVAFFPKQRLPRKGISLRHLLSHTAGLSAKADTAFCLGAFTRRPEEILNTPSETEPGLTWRYCNLGFAIAARVLEEVSGSTYENRLTQTLFEPAQLGQTSVGYPTGLAVARGHARAGEKFGYVSPVMGIASFGSGDIYSTATDLVKWFRALSAGRVIPRELYRLMSTPVVLKSGYATSYGLGMFVSQFGGTRELSQDGNTAGFSSQLASYPDQDLFIAVLTNSSAHDAEGLEKSITRSILGIREQIILDLEVPSTELTSYHGEYTGGAMAVRIFAESGALFISKPNGSVERLLNQGSGVFAENGATDVRIRFASGAATVSRNGKTLALLERLRS